MIYLWEIPNQYPEKFIGEYDEAQSPDRFMFKKGKRLEDGIKFPVIIFNNATLSELSKFGYLASNAMVPVVDSQISSVLQEIAADDVQLIDIVVKAKDGESRDYKLVNITNLVKGIDHEKSEYIFIPGTKQIMKFRSLACKKGCLGASKLARDEEYHSNLLVSEEVKTALSELNLPGLAFYTPEENTY